MQPTPSFVLRDLLSPVTSLAVTPLASSDSGSLWLIHKNHSCLISQCRHRARSSVYLRFEEQTQGCISRMARSKCDQGHCVDWHYFFTTGHSSWLGHCFPSTDAPFNEYTYVRVEKVVLNYGISMTWTFRVRSGRTATAFATQMLVVLSPGNIFSA